MKENNMFKLKNNNKLAILLLHEIYGINNNMRNKSKELHGLGYDVFCPNLLGKNYVYAYEEESEAYINFKNNVGFGNAYKIALEAYSELTSDYDNVFIVGYSVGATLAWSLSKSVNALGVICFYGSRIRDYTYISPVCPVALFFASEEDGFNVQDLVCVLELKNKVKMIEVFEGNHGFADFDGMKFNNNSYLESKKRMMNFLTEQLKVKT
jgi:dienelactone hydrolase